MSQNDPKNKVKVPPLQRSRPAPAGRRPGYIPSVRNRSEEEMVELLDDVSIFREMRSTLLPALRSLIEAGAPSEEIYKLVESITAARLASEAAFAPDFNLGAARELMDRLHGKATEKKDVTHRLEKLKDTDLDALLLTAANESSDEETD
jgi:hypothetical protein